MVIPTAMVMRMNVFRATGAKRQSLLACVRLLVWLYCTLQLCTRTGRLFACQFNLVQIDWQSDWFSQSPTMAHARAYWRMDGRSISVASLGALVEPKLFSTPLSRPWETPVSE